MTINSIMLMVGAAFLGAGFGANIYGYKAKDIITMRFSGVIAVIGIAIILISGV